MLSDYYTTVETRIHVGLEKPVRLLVVSDMHITRYDGADDEYAQKQQHDRRYVFSWEKERPTSEQLFEYWLNESEFADCLVLTGDTVDAPSHGNLAYLERKLRGRNYLYVTGNHDWCFPRNHPPTSDTRATYVPKIEAITGQPFDFYRKTVGEIQLLSVDNGYHQVTEEQSEAVFSALESGQPTVLCCHIPLYINTLLEPAVTYWHSMVLMGAPESAYDKTGVSKYNLPSETTCRFTERLATYKNLVAILAGHVHFNHIDMFTPTVPQIITQTAVHLPIVERDGREVPHGPGQARLILID